MLLGRWARARRWLDHAARHRMSIPTAHGDASVGAAPTTDGNAVPPGVLRVLDVGCAFGFGTSVLAPSRHVRWIGGIEPDATYTMRARRAYPTLAFARGSAESLPITDASLDAVILLDVLEHLADPAAALAEARRVLRPDGRLFFSVPHRGALASLDALNVYTRLRRAMPWLPPLAASEATEGRCHQHFSLAEIAALLGDRLVIERSTVTGVGLVEVIHLALLVLCRGLLRSERLYTALAYLYYTGYLLEDCMPTGRAGYHVFVQARAVEGAYPHFPESATSPG